MLEIQVAGINPKAEADLQSLFLWCEEGWQRSALGEFRTQKQALSRFFLGAMILSDPVLDVLRRELRRVSPEVRIDVDQIKEVLVNEVIKREVSEGDKADEARRKIARAANKSLRATPSKDPKTTAALTENASASEDGHDEAGST